MDLSIHVISGWLESHRLARDRLVISLGWCSVLCICSRFIVAAPGVPPPLAGGVNACLSGLPATGTICYKGVSHCHVFPFRAFPLSNDPCRKTSETGLVSLSAFLADGFYSPVHNRIFFGPRIDPSAPA